MKLLELKGVKKYYDITRYDLEHLLSKEGIKIIGTGRYGTVYWNPSWDYVVKMTTNDPYYMRFIDYVIKNPNKHYPKIKKKPINLRAFYKRHRDNLNEKLFIVKIEKLEPLPKDLGKFIAYHLDEFYVTDYHLKNEHKSEDSKEYLDYHNPRAKILMPDGTYGPHMSRREFAKKFPWMLELAVARHEAAEAADGASDDHANNFMRRADGTVVVIDPAWEGWNPYKEHQRMMDLEMDVESYHDYEDTVSGPAFKIKKQEAEAQKKAAEEMKQRVLQNIAHQIDDDIPF